MKIYTKTDIGKHGRQLFECIYVLNMEDITTRYFAVVFELSGFLGVLTHEHTVCTRLFFPRRIKDHSPSTSANS